jgi:hypothetical protein
MELEQLSPRRRRRVLVNEAQKAETARAWNTGTVLFLISARLGKRSFLYASGARPTPAAS